MKNVLLLFVVAIMFMAKTGYCQDYKSLSDEDFANTPYWVEMMNDESVNFFDVQRAFELNIDFMKPIPIKCLQLTNA
jgi:hypothetical protein